MTPGLALFYGGMVRSKNVLAVIGNNYVAVGRISVLWAAAIVAVVFCFGATWLLAKAVDLTLGLPVSPEDEFVGLDLTQHAESAYSIGGMGRIGN